MISFQKLLSKDEHLYDLLESSAEEARHSVQKLNRILSAPDKKPDLKEFHESKEAEKQITEQINQALVTSFVTQLDREDIEMLSAVLYKIPKTVEKFAERLFVSAIHAATTDFSRHIRLLEGATNQVVVMVHKLRSHPGVEETKGMNHLLQKVESEADDLILEILADLYSDRHHPTKVLAMKDLYELLEKVIDRCRDAGNVVMHIVLKHS
jgi:uncharacterized protein Yka (UPF0111/DUF47 family)